MRAAYPIPEGAAAGSKGTGSEAVSREPPDEREKRELGPKEKKARRDAAEAFQLAKKAAQMYNDAVAGARKTELLITSGGPWAQWNTENFLGKLQQKLSLVDEKAKTDVAEQFLAGGDMAKHLQGLKKSLGKTFKAKAQEFHDTLNAAVLDLAAYNQSLHRMQSTSAALAAPS